MSKLLKIFTAFLACSLLTVSVFASVLLWSESGYEGDIYITKDLRIDVSQNSRTFYAITSTNRSVSEIETTVRVVTRDKEIYVGSDEWTTYNRQESEAFYPVSFSGIPQALQARGTFIVKNNGVTVLNFTSGYKVYE